MVGDRVLAEFVRYIQEVSGIAIRIVVYVPRHMTIGLETLDRRQYCSRVVTYK